MKKTILVFGLIAGILVAIMLSMTAVYMKSTHGVLENGEIWGYTSMLLAFSTIFIAIKSYRDRHLGGVIKFGSAFMVGLGVVLIATFFYVTTWVFILKNVYPDFMEEMTQANMVKMKASGKSAAEMQKVARQMDEWKNIYKSMGGIILMTALEIFPGGLLISLIAALIMKRKTPKVA